MSRADTILTSSEKFIIKLGLERTQKVLDFLGNPQDKLKVIHVAGTNGKGSTCAILSSILKAYGAKTGLYTSPHLFSYCERIKINNSEIMQNELDEIVEIVCAAAKKCNLELSEFEILTISAFYYFAREKTEMVILETGLGGRLDATNVIKKPILSIITSISYDHTERLGESIEEISFEKAGIIKKKTPLIIQKENHGYDTILKKANELEVKVLNPQKIDVGFYSATLDNKKEEFGLLGEHQGENLSLAICAAQALNISKKSIVEGVKNVKHRFRLEYIKERNLLIDGCHNVDGARVLRKFLDQYFKGPINFVFGCLQNKDYGGILEELLQKDDNLYFYEFQHKNALKFSEFPKKFLSQAQKTNTPLKEIKNKELTVICGSLYMLGELFKPS